MGVIMHKGVAYGGGSNVEANPAGSATDDLSKLGIDGTVYDVTDADAVHSTDIGVASGVAGLDTNGKVPTAQLPTYPTVNDGILTIKKNGSTVATFTANQSGNSNADISVPTQPSDINAAAESDIQSTKTTSGNPITITDAAPINAEKLEVVMEPKQDLHGYDYPWVGGAGKNKLNYDDWKQSGVQRGTAVWENNGVTLTATANDCFTYSLNYTYGKVAVSEGDIVKLSWEESTNASGTVYLFNQSGSVLTSQNNNSGKSITYTVASGVTEVRFRFGVSASGTTISYKNIMLQKNTSETTWTPYSNICPITGYDSVSVESVGVNVWDEEWEVGGLNEANGSETSNSSYIRSGFIPLSGSMSIYGYSRVSSQLVAYFYTSDKDYIGFKVITNISYTVPSNTAFCRIRIQVDITNYTRGEISINHPSTDHDYHAYQSTSATITIGQTVYGGEVDFKTGKVTITDANIASYAGETLPSTWISDRDAYSSGGTPTTGAQVVYKLAIHTTLQLTPQELKLLQNTNNITTNGTTITLGYQPNNVVGELKEDIETEHERFYTETAEYAVTFLNNARCVILATSSSDYIPIAAYTDYLFVAIGQIGDNYVGYIKFPDMSEPSESELPIGTEIEFTIVFMRKE